MEGIPLRVEFDFKRSLGQAERMGKTYETSEIVEEDPAMLVSLPQLGRNRLELGIVLLRQLLEEFESGSF